MSEKVIMLCEECSKGNLKNVQKLIKGTRFSRGVSVNSVSTVKISMLSGMTPLMSAAMFGRVYVAEYLISIGADVNARSLGSENTALVYAASNNNQEIVKLLLKSNADKTLKNRDGLTALDYAIKNKYASIISLLEDTPRSEKHGSSEIVSMLNTAQADAPVSEKPAKPEEAAISVKTEVIHIPEQQLITLRLLLGGARAWGSLNGNPLGKEYPQYNKVREIGKSALSRNGDDGLKTIMEQIRSDGSDLYTYLDLMWNNLQNDEYLIKKLQK